MADPQTDGEHLTAYVFGSNSFTASGTGNEGVFDRAYDPVDYHDYNGAQLDLMYETGNDAKDELQGDATAPPETPLVSSTGLRYGCDSGKAQWLVFLAPAGGKYTLGVSVHGGSATGATANFRYRAETQPAGGTVAGGFAGTYPQYFSRRITFFRDSSFFDRQLLTIPTTGSYAGSNCDGEKAGDYYGPVQ